MCWQSVSSSRKELGRISPKRCSPYLCVSNDLAKRPTNPWKIITHLLNPFHSHQHFFLFNDRKTARKYHWISDNKVSFCKFHDCTIYLKFFMIGLVPAQVPSKGVLDMALKKCGKSLFWLANIRNTSDVFKQLTFSCKIKYFNVNISESIYIMQRKYCTGIILI